MTNDNLEPSQPTPEIAPEPATELIAAAPAPTPVPEPVAQSAPAPAPKPAAEPAPQPIPEPVAEEPTESFADLLSAFERSHSHKSEPGAKQLQGTVISLSADQVFLDIGYKTLGLRRQR